MAKVTRSIFINAPVEKVFTFLADPSNLPEIWPSMVETHVTGVSPAGGQDFSWEYKMAGLRLQGEDVHPTGDEEVNPAGGMPAGRGQEGRTK